MRTGNLLLVLVVLSGCAGGTARDGAPAGTAPATAAPAELLTPQADRRRLLDLTRGPDTRVVVIPSDRDDVTTRVAQLEAWRTAGTSHVAALTIDRIDTAPRLLRLAHLIEITDSGPHAALHDATVVSALREAVARGVPVMARGIGESELRECLGQ